MSMRGFGHVKQANVEAARQREAVLLHRLDPQRWPKPAAAGGAGQFRGIPVVGA
jgi:indolepyruvate ferredoxin oxidoreductase